MATEFAVVRTQASTGGGNQDITSPLITDFSAAIIIVYGATGSGTPADHARLGIGFAVSDGTAFAESGRSRDNQADIGGNVGVGSSTRCVCLMGTAASNASRSAVAEAIARSTSGIANGIRLNWTTTPDAAYEMTVILLGGLANAALRTLVASTNFGFQVDAGFVINPSGFSGGDGTASNPSAVNLGFFTNKGSILQVATANGWERDISDPIVTDADARNYSNRASGSINTGTATAGANVTAIGATTVSVTNAEGRCLGIKFADVPNWGTVLASIPAGTGIASFTGLGFVPDLVFGMASLVDATDTTTDGAPASTAAAFVFDTRGNQIAGSSRAQENVALTTAGGAATGNLTDTSTRFDSGKSISALNDAGSLVADAAYAGPVAGGFSLNFAAAGGGRLVLFGLALVHGPVLTASGAGARAGAAARQSRRVVTGGLRPASHIGRVLREVGRFRRAALARIRWLERPETVTPPVGASLGGPPTGRIAQPGLVRGRIAGPPMRLPDV